MNLVQSRMSLVMGDAVFRPLSSGTYGYSRNLCLKVPRLLSYAG